MGYIHILLLFRRNYTYYNEEDRYRERKLI
nr:MAG TPA: hypothetical protein [Caudoviricetes sp.]